MLDLRLATADALEDLEEPMGEWRRDANGRPIQDVDFEIRDEDGDLVVQLDGTLRVFAKGTKNTDGSTVYSLPSRRQMIAVIRNPPEPRPAAEGEAATQEIATQ